MPPAKEPNPVIQKIVTALIGLGMLGFGVYMFIEPASPFANADPTSSRKGGLFIRALDWVWGWPGGVVLCLLGLLIVAGLFMKTTEDGAAEASASDR